MNMIKITKTNTTGTYAWKLSQDKRGFRFGKQSHQMFQTIASLCRSLLTGGEWEGDMQSIFSLWVCQCVETWWNKLKQCVSLKFSDVSHRFDGGSWKNNLGEIAKKSNKNCGILGCLKLVLFQSSTSGDDRLDGRRLDHVGPFLTNGRNGSWCVVGLPGVHRSLASPSLPSLLHLLLL